MGERGTGFRLRGPSLEFPQDPDRQGREGSYRLRRTDQARFEAVPEKDRQPPETLANPSLNIDNLVFPLTS